MEKIKKRIANLKVEGKLKVYQMTVLVMTLFLVLQVQNTSFQPSLAHVERQ